MPWVNSSLTKQTLSKSATFSLQNRSRYWKTNLRGLRRVIIINWLRLLSKPIKVPLVAQRKSTKIRSWPQLLRMSKLYRRSRTMLNSNNKVNRAIPHTIAQKFQHNQTSNNKSWVTTSDRIRKWAILNFITSRLRGNNNRSRKREFSISNQLRTLWKSRAKSEAAVRRNSKSAETISSIWLSKTTCRPWIILKIVVSIRCSSRHNQEMRLSLRANLKLRQIISRKEGSTALTKNSEEVVSNKPGDSKIRLKSELLFRINIVRPSKFSKTLKKSWWITSFIQTKASTRSRTNPFNQDISKAKKARCRPRCFLNKVIWEARPKRWKTTPASTSVASLDKQFKPKILILRRLWVRWRM